MKDQGYGDQFTFGDNFGDGREAGNGQGKSYPTVGREGCGTGAHAGSHLWSGDGTGCPGGDMMAGDGP